MIIIKRIFAILLILSSLVILAHTLYGSVFYAADESGNLSVASETPPLLEPGDKPDMPASTNNPASTAVSKPQLIQTGSPQFPTELIIPTLNIKASVQYVGINAKGNMGTPNNFTDVSWYEPGTIPGEVGSAVMAGHLDNGLKLSGVFKHLSDLGPGDDVFVIKRDGSKLHFKVDRVAVYDYEDVPVTSIFGAKDGIHLNLVTCTGDWMGDQKTYDERIVVYTSLVS